MAQQLPDDFREFLRLLNSHGVEYMLVGGHAVGHYGYVRNTADMDVWVAISSENAGRIVAALEAFGCNGGSITPGLFLAEDRVVAVGFPPLRLDIITTIAGVNFAECYPRRVRDVIEGVEVSIIGLDDLKKNKAASGRPKDLVDLDELEHKVK
jgi:predicted nucleotidyltransferase